MILNTYDSATLHDAFGIDMSTIEGTGVGSGWGRVVPGHSSEPHQHDEIETFVIVRGTGELIIDGARHPAAPGTVVVFEPFETHVIENTGTEDLIFVTFYWRDLERAGSASARRHRGRFDERPVFVFSTPPTPNGDLHLGHLSGPYLGADAFVRFQRLNGATAWHLTGSDDFQSYVVDCARREGRDPAAVAAHYSAEIAETLRLMDIPLDQYTVTNDDTGYRAGLQTFFSRLVDSGQVRAREDRALFDAETGDYLYEVGVKGVCPTCDSGTNGNICEECGEPNSCVDLVDPRASLNGTPPTTGQITRFSLALNEFRAQIQAHHRLGRVPARLRELANRILDRDRLEVAITHPSDWGVPPAPGDTDSTGTSGQVIWVWPEMSYGFLHGIQALGRRLGRDWRADAPQQDWKIVHFFGYDNSFYHSVLYPVLYRLAFPGWTPDIDYHVNEFYLLDGSKFSTSRRHAVWGKQILGPDSVDAVRFFLSATRPEGRRTNFSLPEYERVLRETLIGEWQNWLNDLGRRIESGYGGVAPEAGNWTPEHVAFLARLQVRLGEIAGALSKDGFSLNQAARALQDLVEDTVRFNRQESRTSTLAEYADDTRTAVALELAAARLLAECAAPVMPRFAAALCAALGSQPPSRWPDGVQLVESGTRIDLARRVFFVASTPFLESTEAAGSAVPTWLDDLLRATAQLPAEAPLEGRPLAELGLSSLQTVSLQYQILQETGVDIGVEELTGDHDVTGLAALLAARAAEDGMVRA